ncbi:hypothetical protein C2L71_07630 [Enteroscipio rubneri]|uniref:HTH luxR-type domain-containing protein n=1 Tax=Enteroscipio rubneri TaxID=2070686 RepID=A0A2K2UB12_9ACTN|nr:hypothetical protein C2L71_07630 [Enteroscipio rubneri]
MKAELYLSLGTVNTRISHIYQKLGIHNKDELSAYFEEHDGSPSLSQFVFVAAVARPHAHAGKRS